MQRRYFRKALVLEKYIVTYTYRGIERERRISQSMLSELLTHPDIELVSVKMIHGDGKKQNGSMRLLPR